MSREYFIVARSFAAPFFSDESTDYQKAESPKDALEKYAKRYRHPCGLYAAECYSSADAMHRGEKFLAQWLCNHESGKQKLTKNGSYSYLGHGPGRFEINGKLYEIANPKEGAVV